MAGLAHVREDKVLKVDILDRPGRVVDRRVGADQERCLPVGVAGVDDSPVAGQVLGVTTGTHKASVGGEQVLDLAGQLDVSGRQDDQVVAHPF